jgi:ABC-type hemin transport system ATPase subunit
MVAGLHDLNLAAKTVADHVRVPDEGQLIADGDSDPF